MLATNHTALATDVHRPRDAARASRCRNLGGVVSASNVATASARSTGVGTMRPERDLFSGRARAAGYRRAPAARRRAALIAWTAWPMTSVAGTLSSFRHANATNPRRGAGYHSRRLD